MIENSVVNHPAKYWIKFYLSRKLHTHQRITELLSLVDLGGIDADQVKIVEDDMRFPIPFRPANISHKPSQIFLRQERIYDAWRGKQVMQQAEAILGTKDLRDIVETFILSPLKPEQAVIKINQKIPDANMSVKVYDTFQHYFWNRSEMSGDKWGAFISERKHANKEWLQLAMDSRGASGVQTVLWKTGVGSVRQMEANKIFTDLRNAAYMSAMQIALRSPNRHHAEMLLSYTRAAKLAQEGVESSENAVRDVVKAFNAFKMRHVQTNIPSVKQLTGGNVSDAEGDVAGEDRLDY
jgi:hypothetical protein